MGCRMHLRAVQLPDIEIARAPPAMDIAEDSFVEDDIPEAEAADYLLCLVPPPDAAPGDRVLVYLPVMASELPYGIPFAAGGGIGMPGDAARIHPVRFLQPMPDSAISPRQSKG